MRIFIGYDKAETVAYHVLCHSILRRSSIPVSITPLNRDNLPMFTRPRGEFDSTDFSISRFLVPYLSGYRGWSLFLDSDMLVLGDIAEMANFATLGHYYNTSVRVVQHDYIPRTERKFLGQTQTKYKKKNWSSVMLFNNSLCEKLTVDYVNNAPGLDLHQFRWCDDWNVRSLPGEWNYLVGEEGQIGPPKLVHYTLGTPCFPEYADSPYADLWRAEYEDMTGRAWG